jgi:hypothetical protein
MPPRKPPARKHLGTLPRVTAEELAKDAEAWSYGAPLPDLCPVVRAVNPATGLPEEVKPQRELTAAEHVAVLRAYGLAADLANAQELLLSAGGTPAERANAVRVIDQLYTKSRPRTADNRRFVELVETINSLSSRWVNGREPLGSELAPLRGLLATMGAEVGDGELVELLDHWATASKAKPKWPYFIGFCQRHGIPLPSSKAKKGATEATVLRGVIGAIEKLLARRRAENRIPPP